MATFTEIWWSAFDIHLVSCGNIPSANMELKDCVIGNFYMWVIIVPDGRQPRCAIHGERGAQSESAGFCEGRPPASGLLIDPALFSSLIRFWLGNILLLEQSTPAMSIKD